MISHWSESRHSLANRGPQRSALATPTSLARLGTTPNSPECLAGSTWYCRTACPSFGHSTFVEPASGPGVWSLFYAAHGAEHAAALAAFLLRRFGGMPCRVASRAGPVATGHRNCRHAQPPFRPFTEADEVSFADNINRADPDFVWVALPGVRMERWIIDNQARYRRGVFLAVGDAFSLLSGRRRSPLMDATDGLDVGLPAVQGTAASGPALPAIQFHVRILCFGTCCAGGLGRRLRAG